MNISKNEWENKTAEEWLTLLPQFANECTRYKGWEKFEAIHWHKLFFENRDTRFLDEYNRKKNHRQFTLTECRNCLPSPMIEKYCDENDIWKRFGSNDWEVILRHHPYLSDKCDSVEGWRFINGYDWYGILQFQPQFADKCSKYDGWQKMTSESWSWIIGKHTKFLKFMPEDIWQQFSSCELANIFSYNPKLIPYAKKRIPDVLKMLQPSELCRILDGNPYIAEEIRETADFSKFDNYAWSEILSLQPQFATECDKYKAWENLRGFDWRKIILAQPQFVEKCDEFKGWAKMDGDDWIEIFESSPEYENRCEECKAWGRFDCDDWYHIMTARPHLVSKCDEYKGWSDFDGEYWYLLLRDNPEFCEHCDKYDGWELFAFKEKILLLLEYPQFADRFEKIDFYNEADGEIWGNAISRNSELIDLCIKYRGYEKFTSEQWINILPLMKNEFIKIRAWDKFSETQWIHIVDSEERSPYIDKCIDCGLWKNVSENDRKLLIERYPYLKSDLKDLQNDKI